MVVWQDNCERFKVHLSVGNSVDLNKAFKDFIGHDMQIEPYLRNAGLLEKNNKVLFWKWHSKECHF
jgi:Zn-dependent oligopeptidase